MKKRIKEKNFKIFISLILVGLMFTSCKKYLDWNIIDKGRKNVVNALFIADSVPQIFIFQSTHILDDSENKIIENATVELNINSQQNFNLQYSSLNKSYSDTSVRFHIGDKINLSVQTSLGLSKVQANIPSKINIIKLDTLANYDNSGERHGLKIKITFKDPSESKDYYMIYLQIGQYVENISYDETDPALEELNNRIFVDDVSFNGNQKTVTLIFNDFNNLYYSNVIYINLMHVDENFYKYSFSMYKQLLTGDSPFSEPVIVYNNVENGYGIGGAASISRDSLVLGMKFK